MAHDNKLHNLGRMGKFIEKCKLLKLTQQEKDLNRSIKVKNRRISNQKISHKGKLRPSLVSSSKYLKKD